MIQKTAEATGGFIGKKIADKITKISKQHSQNNLDEAKNEREIPEEDIFPQKKSNKLLMN